MRLRNRLLQGDEFNDESNEDVITVNFRLFVCVRIPLIESYCSCGEQSELRNTLKTVENERRMLVRIKEMKDSRQTRKHCSKAHQRIEPRA